MSTRSCSGRALLDPDLVIMRLSALFFKSKNFFYGWICWELWEVFCLFFQIIWIKEQGGDARNCTGFQICPPTGQRTSTASLTVTGFASFLFWWLWVRLNSEVFPSCNRLKWLSDLRFPSSAFISDAQALIFFFSPPCCYGPLSCLYAWPMMGSCRLSIAFQYGSPPPLCPDDLLWYCCNHIVQGLLILVYCGVL